MQAGLVVLVAAKGFHQQGDTRAILTDEFEHHLLEVRAVVAAVAVADADHPFACFFVTVVVAAVDVEAGRIEMRLAAREP